MREMCLELSNPEKVQVSPASSLLNKPIPMDTLPRTVCSPVPTYITLGSAVLTLTQPIDPPNYPSDMFVQESPPLVVFQTPPPTLPK